MARSEGGLGSKDAQAIHKTANATQQLVRLNKETGKQTKWMIALTIIIAILTLIMAIPVVRDVWNYMSQKFT
ncbi:hypothetical protein KAI65_00820 [Candidatus Parcubacteria bacterium]|nr:hypothetical protein [Candidatus Parcubacteria bacterium]